MPQPIATEAQTHTGRAAVGRRSWAVMTWTWCRSKRGSRWAVAALLGLTAFLVYWRTLAPSIVWGDSPELTAAAFTAGVPHPTGYPLYMMLAHAFMHLCPLGSIAYRMNLLSAISGACAVAFIYLLMLRVTRSRSASLVATLMFAFSRTFWSQAVIAEHYPFEVLCMAAVLGCVLAWEVRGERRWLFASAVVYGLCLTHHMMSLLLAPGLLYFALTSRHRPQFVRELRWTVPLFLLPLSLYVYLPLAALRDPPLNWGDPRTWGRFVAHVTGQQYHQLMFHGTVAELGRQVGRYVGLCNAGGGGYLLEQFSPGFLWLAPLGAGSLARRRRRLFGLTLLIYMADLIYALHYQVYNVEIYYLPSHLMVALWIGCGLRQAGAWMALLWRKIGLLPRRRQPLNRILGTALLVLPLTVLSTSWSVNDRHGDWSALVYARAALATLKPNAVVIGQGDFDYFPLLYSRFVENQRPDVTLIEEYDLLSPSYSRLVTRLRSQGLTVRIPFSFQHNNERGSFHSSLLKQLIADNVGSRPVYVLASPDHLRAPWLTQVIAPYYQVADCNMSRIELTRHAPQLATADPHPQRGIRSRFCLAAKDEVGDELEFLGYDASPFYGGNVPMQRLTYYWRVDDPAKARAAKVWVVFTDGAGNYQRGADGTPAFHNIHPLAYGLAQHGVKLPRTLQETYTLFVPPGEWDKPLHMRLAVFLDGKFLPAGTAHDPWVEVGTLPPASMRQWAPRLASAAAPSRRGD